MLNVLIPSPQEIPFTPCVLISLSLSFSLSLSLGLLSSPSFPWRHLKPEVCLLCPPTIPSGYFWNKLMLLDESYKSTNSWNFQCGARIVSRKVLLQHCEQRCIIHFLYLILDSHAQVKLWLMHLNCLLMWASWCLHQMKCPWPSICYCHILLKGSQGYLVYYCIKKELGLELPRDVHGR